MSNNVAKQAGKQLGEATKQIAKDTGHKLIETIPGGRHVVGGMDARAEHSSSVESGSLEEAHKQDLTLEELKEIQKREDQVQLKKLRQDLISEMQRSRNKRKESESKRLKRFSEEMREDKPNKGAIAGQRKSKSIVDRVIAGRKGVREMGRGRKG